MAVFGLISMDVIKLVIKHCTHTRSIQFLSLQMWCALSIEVLVNQIDF